MESSINRVLWEAIQRNTSWITRRCAQSEFHPQKREELFQDVMLKLVASNDHFLKKEDVNADAWVKTITSNTAVSYQGKQKNTIKAEIIEDYDSIEGHQDRKQNIVDMKAIIKFIRAEFNQIDQEIMDLVLMKEEYENIAEIVGMTKGSVANKVSKLKMRIREHFFRGTNG